MLKLNPLFVKCALRELNLLGFHQAVIDKDLAVIVPNPDIPYVFMNDKVVKVFGAKNNFSTQDVADLENVRERCSEMVSVFQSSSTLDISTWRKEQLLMSYYDMVLTGKEVDDGITFSIWKSDQHYERTSYEMKYETRDYPKAKLKFCLRSGLLQPEHFDMRLSEHEMERVADDLMERGISDDTPTPPNYVTAFDAVINTVNNAFARRMDTLGADPAHEQEIASGPAEPSMG